MSKKLLAILTIFIITVVILAGCVQEAPGGEITETPPPSSTMSDTEPEASTPDDSSESTPPPTTIAAPSTLTILSISIGDVFVMKAGTDEWVEAEAGISVEAGDSLKSGDDSTAEITFFDGSTIELEPNTQIQVTELDIAADTGATTILLKQELGDTISRVTKLADPASRYEVETPAGIAAVRGSVMLVEVLGSGKTKITNIEGDIWAISGGKAVPIPEGRICTVTPGQPPVLKPVSSGPTGGGGSVTVTTDLALDKSDDPDPVDPGAELTYTLQITNNGPSNSTGAVIVDALPPEVSFVSATDDGTYDAQSHTVSWAIGALADNTSTSVSITVQVDIATAPGIIINTATVSANEYDNDSANDSAIEETTVNDINDPPVAEDDSADTPEDTPVTIDVLANDSDVDAGDTLSVESVTQGTNGSVVNNGGDVTYTPNLNFSGSDSFEYTVSDGNGGTDTAYVTVTVIRTHAVIEVIVDTPIEASLYIWDETEGQYAVDEDTQSPVDGTSRTLSCSVTVASGHCYTVWVLKDGYTFTVRHDPAGWYIVAAPEGDGNASSGCADEAITYEIWFDVIS